jgi:hypothetical protein
MFWTIFLIVKIFSHSEPTYVGVESFRTRAGCESNLMTRHITIDNMYELDFKCLKTDEPVNN